MKQHDLLLLAVFKKQLFYVILIKAVIKIVYLFNLDFRSLMDIKCCKEKNLICTLCLISLDIVQLSRINCTYSHFKSWRLVTLLLLFERDSYTDCKNFKDLYIQRHY